VRTINSGRLPDGFEYLIIPRSILEIEGLTLQKKALLAEVFALQKSGGCRATNAHLGLIIGCCDRQVRGHLSELEAAGHLTIKNRHSIARRIWVSDQIAQACSGVLLTAKPLAASNGHAEKPERLSRPESLPSPSPMAEPRPKKERNKSPSVDDHAMRELPDFISRDQWREFVSMRHDEHGPFSEGSAKGVISKITRLREEGYCPAKLLTGAIEGRWQSVYDNDRFKASAAGSGDRHFRPGVQTLPSGAQLIGGRVVL
jgi:hypothetical protein